MGYKSLRNGAKPSKFVVGDYVRLPAGKKGKVIGVA